MKKIVLLGLVLITNIANGKETMNYEIQTQKLNAQPVFVMKGRAAIDDIGEAIGARIGAVAAFLEKSGLEAAGAPFTRTYSFEDGVFEFESGFAVLERTRGEGDVIASELPAGDVATTVHRGDQAASVEAYTALENWMQANGKKPAGAPWEVYLDENTMQIFYPIQSL